MFSLADQNKCREAIFHFCNFANLVSLVVFDPNQEFTIYKMSFVKQNALVYQSWLFKKLPNQSSTKKFSQDILFMECNWRKKHIINLVLLGTRCLGHFGFSCNHNYFLFLYQQLGFKEAKCEGVENQRGRFMLSF